VIPGVIGPALAELLRDRRPELPVVYMSGYEDGIIAGKGVDAGSAFLQKPFTPRQLVATLDCVLAGGRT
jgi:FixJ family two-component response regulator